MKKLTYCTLTGVDEKTDLAMVCALSRAYRFAEWGLLYSPKRQGEQERYPSMFFLQKTLDELPDYVNIALHICGAGVQQLIEGEALVNTLVHLIDKRHGRVQLNFNASTIEGKFTIEQLKNYLKNYHNQHSVEFITQYNGANAKVWSQLTDLKNHAVLFDASGGQGISACQWQHPLPGLNCGYEGGLGVDNVAQELINIQNVVKDEPFWIDMESKLRDADDRFDIDVASSVLSLLDNFKFAK